MDEPEIRKSQKSGTKLSSERIVKDIRRATRKQYSAEVGLHGHLWKGPLASVQSQIDLRRQFAAEAAFCAAVDVREPVGARASALYSVAQRMCSRREKLRQFRMAAARRSNVIEMRPTAPYRSAGAPLCK